jgi:hypothetical protein
MAGRRDTHSKICRCDEIGVSGRISIKAPGVLRSIPSTAQQKSSGVKSFVKIMQGLKPHMGQ